MYTMVFLTTLFLLTHYDCSAEELDGEDERAIFVPLVESLEEDKEFIGKVIGELIYSYLT